MDHNSKKSEEIVAILDGIQILVQDLQLLRNDDAWIPDSVIGFYLEHLRQDHELKGSKDDVAIIAPPVAQFIKVSQSKEEVVSMIQPLKLPEKKIVLAPVNNAKRSETSTGTHWSLLVLDMINKQYIHVDSLSMNSSSAERIAKKLLSALDLDPQEVVSKEFTDQRQIGTSICGQHVMSNARRAINQFFVGHGEGFNLVEDFKQVNNEEINVERKYVWDTIVKVAIEQKRFDALKHLIASEEQRKSEAVTKGGEKEDDISP